MVRFSDMLGGNGEPERARAAPPTPDGPPDEPAGTDELPEPEPEPEPELPEPELPEPEAAEAVVAPQPPRQSPQDVLERLTQYASSARAADRTPAPAAEPRVPAPQPEPEPAPAADPDEPRETAEEEIAPVGDDLLPRARRVLRKPGRGKRHP